MRTRTSSFAAFLALALCIDACGGSPIAPSGANPISSPSMRAEVGTVVLWEGSPNCTMGCGPAKQVMPNADGAYELMPLVSYTLEYGIKNPGVPGRCIAATMVASWYPQWAMNADLSWCAPEDGNFGPEMRSSGSLPWLSTRDTAPYIIRIWGEERGTGLAEPHRFSKEITVVMGS